MAVDEDDVATSNWFRTWGATLDCKRVVLLSPSYRQTNLVKSIFYQAHVVSYQKSDWDLDLPCPHKDIDLVVACSVFQRASKPSVWFNNVFSASKYLWLQDCFSRRRNGNYELGTDGDCMRYGLNGVYNPRSPVHFDLWVYLHRLIDFRVYDATGTASVDTAPHINFVAYLRGDL